MTHLVKNRFKAIFLDVAIIFMLTILITIGIMLAGINYESKYLKLVVLGIIYTLVICKDVIKGQSIGKKVFGIQVVNSHFRELKLSFIILRNMFIFICPLDVILIILNRQRIGDSAFSSKVSLYNDKLSYYNSISKLLFAIILVFICITLIFFSLYWIPSSFLKVK